MSTAINLCQTEDSDAAQECEHQQRNCTRLFILPRPPYWWRSEEQECPQPTKEVRLTTTQALLRTEVAVGVYGGQAHNDLFAIDQQAHNDVVFSCLKVGRAAVSDGKIHTNVHAQLARFDACNSLQFHEDGSDPLTGRVRWKILQRLLACHWPSRTSVAAGSSRTGCDCWSYHGTHTLISQQLQHRLPVVPAMPAPRPSQARILTFLACNKTR